MNISNMLTQRGKSHGDYPTNAKTTILLYAVVRRAMTTKSLDPQLELSVLMILQKISRIVSGDPTHKDHWDDIKGYAELATQALDQK